MKTGVKVLFGFGAVAALVGSYFAFFKKKDDASNQRKIADKEPQYDADGNLLDTNISAGQGKQTPGILLDTNISAGQGKQTPGIPTIPAGKGKTIPLQPAGKGKVISGFSDEILTNMHIW
ncbi:MAG: hypothetical protein WC707_06915 [Candidatus Babeliaceae bacterium]|jgi:hypothetical protein